jgi:hypothetical protein
MKMSARPRHSNGPSRTVTAGGNGGRGPGGTGGFGVGGSGGFGSSVASSSNSVQAVSLSTAAMARRLFVARVPELRQRLVEMVGKERHAEQIRRRALVMSARGFRAQFVPIFD